ncbi:MAG: MBL fold metallo-hydrolase RNA specificity domain-containing protein, partial [Hominilimicola sp.]
NQELPVNPNDVDCVLLTHAHIDHSGNLPLLYKNGFRGKIYATEETTNLCSIMLPDSAHIQEQEAKWRNRKAKRSGREEYIPVYDIEDAIGVQQRFYPCRYNEKLPILENVEIRFHDIGHLLGSSCIEIWITEEGVTKKIVFSGDVGNINQPIIKDPTQIAENDDVDYLVIESTYGNRYHTEVPDYVATFAEAIQKTFDRGGNVVIPSFAVGRTQELLYFIRQIKERGLVKGHGNFSVYVDSPLANEATAIFLQCNFDCLDEEAREIVSSGINPLTFPGLKLSVSTDESVAINFDTKPKVIISSSGMCEAGRIRHHLKHNLWRSECLIMFVGYQAEGTLGRMLCDGVDTVKLFGEEIAVNAEIMFLEGISGHADKNGLIRWLQSFGKKPDIVFVNHGEETSCDEFTDCIRDEYGYNAVAPYSGTCYDLMMGKIVTQTYGIRKERKKPTKRAATVFARLIAAAERLLAVAKSCEGMANKDLAKFADQIDRLSDKWKR